MPRYCSRNGCINTAESENYVKDTPLCTPDREVLQRFIRSGTEQRWVRNRVPVIEVQEKVLELA